jgi:hypothetical protein
MVTSIGLEPFHHQVGDQIPIFYGNDLCLALLRSWLGVHLEYSDVLQAAGHHLTTQGLPSLLVSEDGSLLKIMQDEVRGGRELQFYACVELCLGSTQSWCVEMRSTLEKRAALAHHDARYVIRHLNWLGQALDKLYGITWCIPRCCMPHLCCDYCAQ